MRSDCNHLRRTRTTGRPKCGTVVESLLRALKNSPDWAILVKSEPVGIGRRQFVSHDQQSARILGVPIGSAAFVGSEISTEMLFHRIPMVDDTQACWLLLLMCATTRGNFWLRAIRAEQSEPFAERHDTNMWMRLRSILGSERAPDSTEAISQLPFSLGGLGLTSAVRSSVAAHWSNWADCVHMIRQRHPSVAETFFITNIHRGPTPCFATVRTCQGTLEATGLEIPSWKT